MREQVVTSTASVPSIYRACTNSLASDTTAAAKMPTYASVKSGLYRRRHRLIPQLPQSRQDIIIPEVYGKTTKGEEFLLHCSEENNLIILCSSANLNLLCRSSIWSIDGTFDAVPHLYKQLFTVHVFEDDKLLPVVYCLMSCKTSAAYMEVFKMLKQKASERNLILAPNTIISDFESGLIPAIREVFPTAGIKEVIFTTRRLACIKEIIKF